jgi:hypothetical protein
MYRLVTSVVIVVLLHFWYQPPPKKSPPKETPRRQQVKLENLPDDLVLSEENDPVTRKEPMVPKIVSDGTEKAKKKSTKEKEEIREEESALEVKESAKSKAATATATPSDKPSAHKDEEDKVLASITSAQEEEEEVYASNDAVSGPSSPNRSATNPSTRPQSSDPPKFLHTSDNHPGMEAYWHWHDVETSLFRVYTIASRETEGGEFTAIPPYNPSSRRGTVSVHLQVTNFLLEGPIDVFWIDYKGREVPKGTIQPRETWFQTTWIDHPWLFRCADRLLLHYVPYRIIPTTHLAPTINPSEPNVGVHRFTIRPALHHPSDSCRIDDPILPVPARDHLITPQLAVEWALLHCSRMSFDDWDLLMKCGSNILHQPDNPKYRSLRLSNRQFGPRIWQTAARGVMLAVGFYEHKGYAQVGGQTLSRARVQELSVWVWMIQQWKQRMVKEGGQQQQPVGAEDGFGRAGYGRAGTMNR